MRDENEVDLSRIFLPGPNGTACIEGEEARQFLEAAFALLPPTVPTLADLMRPIEPADRQAPTLEDDTTARQALRDICHFADVLELDGSIYLVVKATPLLLDLLAAFESEEEDIEDDDPGGESAFGPADDEPSLGATNDKNQERAWKHAGSDLEYEADDRPECDLEDGLDLEAENEHGGDVQDEPHDEDVDREPYIGATEDIDQRVAWGSATELEQEAPRGPRPGIGHAPAKDGTRLAGFSEKSAAQPTEGISY